MLSSHALGTAIGAILWLTPPAVLPTPSRTGPEGPPRPYGAAPATGAPLAPTPAGLSRSQYRQMLLGPFPHDGLVRGVSDGTVLLNPDATERALAVRMIVSAKARVARIPVDWRDLVASTPPSGFEAADPASPSYDFSTLDAAVLSAVAGGLQPLLVVSHAPAFAEAPARWPYAYAGSWDPSPLALEQFAHALAERYDGSFPDPGDPSRALPRVALFQAWNEPNLARYLEPQWVVEEGRWSAFTPSLYRQLLNGFYAGVKAVQPTAQVIAAGLAPDGEAAGLGRMTPIAFLQGLLCIDGAGRRVRAGCGEPAHFDALAFHPLSVETPDVSAPAAQDVAIADAAKVTRLLGRARALGTALPRGAKPVWVTELNWESAPQAEHGVRASLQAAWLSRALHRLWIAGVSQVDWQFLVDPFPALRAATPTGGLLEYQRPAGLYGAGLEGQLSEARPKPFLLGFEMPFDPLRVNSRRVRVWALLSEPRQAVLLQREIHRAWRTVARLRADHAGVLNAMVSLAGSARLRLLSGGLRSYTATVPSRR